MDCFHIIQLQCCGIEGPKDWDRNIYFNCSSAEVGSREACGVPFSCCKPQVNVNQSCVLSSSVNTDVNIFIQPLQMFFFFLKEIIKNKQCGYDVRKPDYVSNFPSFLEINAWWQSALMLTLGGDVVITVVI